MKVKVKGKGVKLNGIWIYKGEEAIIDEEQYEKNKEFVDIIEDEEGPQLPQVPGKEDEDNEDELQELRAKAKELGIRNYHLMGKEKLELAIAEKESENKNSANNPNKNDTDVDNDETKSDGGDNPEEKTTGEEKTGEGNPQE